MPGEGNGEQIDGFLKVRAAGGRSVTVPELPLFTAPAGDALYRYVFSGWKLEDGTILKNGGEYALPAGGGELTLTAQWSKQVKVELPDPTVSLAEDGTATFEIDLPELPGYDLTVRWQYANGFTTHAANPNESEDPANATDTVNPVSAAGTQNAEQTDGERSVHTEESDAGFTAGLNAAIRPDKGEIAQWHDIPDASGVQYVRTIESGDYSRHFRCVAYAVEAEAALVEVSPEDSQVDFHVYMLTAEPGTGSEEKAIVALFPEEQSDDGDQTAGVAASQPEAQPKERGVAAKTVKSPTPESLGTGRRETVEAHTVSAGTAAKPSLMRAALTKMSPQAEDSPSERFAARRVFTSSGSEAMQKETPEVLVSGAVDLRAPTAPAANTVGWNADGTVYTPTALVNGGFEEGKKTGWVGVDGNENVYCLSPTLLGWSTTDSVFEIWRNYGFYRPAPYKGTFYVELNAYEAGTLYQQLPTTPGEVIQWSLAHRGRDGEDTMAVFIGPTFDSREKQKEIMDGKDAWGVYSGTYRVPQGQFITCFSFDAIKCATGNLSVGNFLDEIEFKTVISPAYVKMEGTTMTMRVYSEVATTATLCYQIDSNDSHEMDGAMVNKYMSVSLDLQELAKKGKLSRGKHTLYVWPKNSEELRSKKVFEITDPLTGVAISASNRVYTGMDTGRTLTASLLPKEGTAAYQWKRDGVDIPGATGTSYVLTDEDGGCAVSVTATGTGYYTGSVTASFQVDPAEYIFDLTLSRAGITPVTNITGNSTPYRVRHIYNSDAIVYKITPHAGYQLPATVKGLTSGKDVTYTLAADGKTATLLVGRKATNRAALTVEVTPINYAFTLTLNHATISPTTNLTGSGSPYTVSHVYDTTEVEYTITADDHYQLPETATGLVTGKDVTYTRSADGKTATLKVGEKAANTAALTVAATSLTYTFTITMDNAHISPDTNLTHQGSTYRVNHVYGADAVEYVISPDRGYALPETVAGLTAGAGVTYQKAPGTNHTATLKVERTSVYTGDITIEPILWKTYNVFLDQANGDDNNLGSRAQPVKTLNEAKLRLFQNGVDNAINGYDESKLATIWVKSTYSLGSNENWNLLGYGAWDANRHAFDVGCIRRDPLCEGYLFQTGTSGSVRLDNMVLDGNDMVSLAFQDTSGTSFTTADMRRISGKRYASILCVSAGATVELGSNAIVRGNTATSHSAVSQQTLEGCGGGVIVYGTLNLQGSITSNTAQESGGGVMVAEGGTFRINGGKIFTNEAKNGGGIAVAQGGSLLLEQGGRVFTNKAHSGGGVSVDHGGTLSINSGDISGNRAEDTAGGVYLNGNMEISGQVSVRENIVGAIGAAEKASNVYLCADKHMTVTGSLESSDSQKSDIYVGTANNAANDLIAVGKDGSVKLDSASAGYFTPEGVLPIIYRADVNGKAAGLYLGGDFINISVPMKLMFAAFSNYNSGQVLSPEYSIVNNSPYYELETEVYCGARTLQGGTDGFKLQDEVRGLRLEPVSGFHGGTRLTPAVFLHDAPAGGTLADEAKYSLGLIDRASKNAAGETVGAQGVFKFTGALGKICARASISN